MDEHTETDLAAVTGLLADAGLPTPTRHHSLDGFRYYQTGAAVPGASPPPGPVRRTGRARRAGPLAGVGVPARIRVRVWADDGPRVQIAVADRFDLQIYEVTFTPVTAVALPALAATLTALLAERRTS